MLGILSQAVVRSIISTVKAESWQFAVVVDVTQDCAGLKQESLCRLDSNCQRNVHWVIQRARHDW